MTRPLARSRSTPELGVWKDFATGDGGSDLISLVAYVDGISQGEAARLVAEKLSISTYKSNGSKGHTTEPSPQIFSWGEEGPPIGRDEVRRHYYPNHDTPKLKVKIKKTGRVQRQLGDVLSGN